MSAQRPKKNRAMRGSRTHGWGHPKKHRGKGSRGGVGKSGMGKRGQHKMSLLNSLGIKNIGKSGFVRPPSTVVPSSALNLRDIELHIEKWLKKGIAKEEKNVITLDASAVGVTKILGAGRVSRKMVLKADKISASAKKKIEAAGGKAEALIVEEEAEVKVPQEKKSSEVKNIEAKNKKVPKEERKKSA